MTDDASRGASGFAAVQRHRGRDGAALAGRIVGHRLVLTLVCAVVLAGVARMFLGMLSHAEQLHGIRGGFDFLADPAGFRIAESLISVAPEDSVARAIAAGIANTVSVTLCVVPLATLPGLLLGLLRVTRHPLLSRMATYVAVPLRNVPVLLHLFVWYALLLALPPVRDAWHPLPFVFVSNRGLFLPLAAGFAPWLIALAAGASVPLLIGAAWGKSKRYPGFGIGWRIVISLTGVALAWAALCALRIPLPRLDAPVLQGFSYAGGLSLSPERLALLGGLSVYHATYVADIVTGALRGVPLGQWQAGQALGLSAAQNARWIILPRAARAALPAYANQCVMMLKNSSLAVVIGYPDLTSVLGSVIAQHAQALECLVIGAASYLLLGYAIGALADACNARLTRNDIADRSGATLGERLHGDAVTIATLGGSPLRLALTLMLLAATGAAAFALLQWGVIDAVASGSTEQCRAASGACWAALRDNANVLTFGSLDRASYPRAASAMAFALAGALPALAGIGSVASRAAVFVAGAVLAAAVLSGAAVAPPIPVVSWSGAMVTVILAAAAIAAALPLALALALCRWSAITALRWPSVALIESVRGVPLVMQLMFVGYLVPFVLGGEWSQRKFALAWLTLGLHTACMLAEALRGGLQAVSRDQSLAARALGLNAWQTLAYVVVPQALRQCRPAAIGVLVGAVKDTSLVAVVGLLDIVGDARMILADGFARQFSVEIYLAVGGVYLLLCLSLSLSGVRRNAAWQ